MENPPLELVQVRELADKVFQNVELDFSRLETQVGIVQEIDLLVSRLNQFMHDSDAQAQDLLARMPTELVERRELADALSFYQQVNNDFKDIISQVECAIDKFRAEIDTYLNHAIDSEEFVENYSIRSLKSTVRSQVDRLQSKLYDQQARREKLLNDFKSALACEREAKACMDNLERELNEVRQFGRTECTELSTKQIRDLMNRIKTDGSVTRETLNKSVQTVIQTMLNDHVPKDTVQFGRLVEAIRTVPTRFDAHLAEVQSGTERLLIDHQELAKVEGYLLNQANDVRRELDLIASTIKEYHTKLDGTFDEDDFSELNQQVQQLSNKLDTQNKRIETIQQSLTKQLTMSGELKTKLSQLDKLYTEVRANLANCDRFRETRLKAVRQYRQAVNRCESALSHMERQIDLLCKHSESKMEQPSHTKQIDQLIDQLRSAKAILSAEQQPLSRPEDKSKVTTELSSAIEILVQSAADLNLYTRGSEWTRYLLDIDRYLARLSAERERLNRAADLKQSCLTRISEVEHRLAEIEKVLHIELQSSTASPILGAPSERELHEIGFELQRLDEMIRQLNIWFPEDHGLALDRLSQSHTTHSRLMQLCSQIRDNYQAKAVEEDQFNSAVVEILKQVTLYKERLTDLETNLPMIGENISDSGSPLGKFRQWLATDLPRVQKLESDREEIDQKLREIELRMISEKSPRLTEVRTCLGQIKPERVQCLLAEMNRHKSNLEQFELMHSQMAQFVTEFELRRDRLCENSFHLHPGGLDESVITQRSEEQKWNKLLEEIDRLKTDRIPELTNLETRLPVKVPKSMSQELQERLHALYLEVSKKVEQNSRMNALRGRLSTSLKLFQEAVTKARTDYGRILQTLALRSKEVDGTQRPTDICEIVQRRLDSAVKLGVTFRTDTFRRLNEMWQQIVNEAKQVEAEGMVKDGGVYATFMELQADCDHFQEELQNLNDQIKQLRQQWIESTQSFEVQQLTEPNDIILDQVTPMTATSPIWSIAGPLNASSLPTENELTNEAKQNITRLQLQMTSYQKRAQTLEGKYKTLVEEKSMSEQLTNELFDILQSMESLVSHKFNDSNQADTDRKVTYESTRRAMGALRTRYQTSQNEMSEAVRVEQTRMTHLGRLIQSVGDLDTWNLEFYTLLSGWLKSHKGRTVNSGAEMNQLKFSLAQGQTYCQSIEDWCKQLAEADTSVTVAALIRAQINRANQIMRVASSQPEQFRADLETRGHLAKQISQDIAQQVETLSAWQQRFKHIKNSTIKLMAIACKDYDGLRQISFQLSECLENLEEQCTQLRADRARFEQKKESWEHVDSPTKSQIDCLEKDFDTCQKTADELIKSLEQVRLRFVDVNTFIQRSRQWLHEVSEQIPKARESRVSSVRQMHCFTK